MALRLLLVDDNEDIRTMVELALQGVPVELVGQAADGIEAIKLTRELQPDVILMDIIMPTMNGVTATRTIHAEFPDITVIGFTGSDRESVDEMLRAGAVAVFLKTSFAQVIERLQKIEQL